MPQLGNLTLAIALILAVYSIVANIYGARRGAPDFVVSARHAIWAMCAMVTIAVVVLWISLLRSDFSLEYVAAYSSTTLPTVYKVTSLWGGQQGSLLFWTWLLSIFTSIAAFQNRRRNPEIAPYALAVLASVAIFFLLMLNFVTRPFDSLATVPAANGMLAMTAEITKPGPDQGGGERFRAALASVAGDAAVNYDMAEHST